MPLPDTGECVGHGVELFSCFISETHAGPLYVPQVMGTGMSTLRM